MPTGKTYILNEKKNVMERYRKISFWATICVALFIVNFAFCILCMNKTIYEKCLERDVPSEDVQLENFERKANFDKLSEEFKAFFKGKYELVGYELDKHNTDRLNHIKWRYRRAWLVSIACLAGMVYCFVVLSKRRMFMPFVYGSALSVFFTAVNALLFLRSDREFFSAARDMVFRENYGYFSDGDILLQIIPTDYARWMAISYLMFVAVLAILMIIVRWFIMFLGRPHKF